MSEEKPNLIVDQERFSSLIMKMLAGRYESDTASDGPTAINKLREMPSDVLVAEESVGGIRLAELVGMSDKFNHIPIILTSTKPSPDSIIRSRNAGISTFLAKPFRPSELISRIDAAIEQAGLVNGDAASGDEMSEQGKERTGFLVQGSREADRRSPCIPCYPRGDHEPRKER